jgi:hypothetical protein
MLTKEILEVIQREPLFCHQIRSKIPTHWFCFMKIANPLTSPNGDFSNEKEHNISLKTTPLAPSKLPSATSLNNNIKSNHNTK